MKSIKREMENLIEINKSKFIGIAFPIFSLDDAKIKLSQLSEKYKDATHICYAYTFNGSVEKCSDDGEPSGTAGKPILEILKKRKLDNMLLCVVRFFGGIKLGAGGLVRAYSNSACAVLDLCEVIEFVKYDLYQIFVDMKTASNLEKKFKNDDSVRDLSVDYASYLLDKVCVQFKIKCGELPPNLLKSATLMKAVVTGE